MLDTIHDFLRKSYTYLFGGWTPPKERFIDALILSLREAELERARAEYEAQLKKDEAGYYACRANSIRNQLEDYKTWIPQEKR